MIAPYKVMETPPGKLIVSDVSFDLCKYKKSETDPTLYRLYYSELLKYFTGDTHIFTDGSKDGDKTAAAFICQYFEFSKRLPDKASIFTAELEAIVSALRSIKSTTKKKIVIFVTRNPHCMPCGIIQVGSSHSSNYYEIVSFFQTVHKTVIFCWLPSRMGISGNERTDSAAKSTL